MRKNVLPFVFLIGLVIIAFLAHSQGNLARPMPRLVPNTPVDGGVFLLMAAGLFYGAKVLYRKD